MQAGDEDFELKQMRDMAAAKKRWDALIREGKVKILTPREAGYAIQLSNNLCLMFVPLWNGKRHGLKPQLGFQSLKLMIILMLELLLERSQIL